MKMRSLYKTKTWEVVELLCVKKKANWLQMGIYH